MMKASEIITTHRNEIAEAIRDHLKTVYRCGGRLEYQMYIWDDGEIECLESVSGSSVWLAPKDSEPRRLIHVTTVKAPGFCPWDGCYDDIPEDAEERERAEAIIIDEIMSSADTAEMIYDMISDAVDYYEREDD